MTQEVQNDIRNHHGMHADYFSEVLAENDSDIESVQGQNERSLEITQANILPLNACGKILTATVFHKVYKN